MANSTELYHLLRNDDWEAIDKLLNRGMAVDGPIAIDDESLPSTPLQQAASLGVLRVIQGLVRRGARLDYSKTYGSPLYCAVAFGQIEAAKCLLENGADPNGTGPPEVEGDGRWTSLL